MPSINVQRFLGIAPKIGDTVIGPTQAQIARNAKLWSQKLRAFGGPGNGEVLSKTTGDIKTIYRFKDDTWLCWTQDVDVVRGPIAGDALEKTYFTGTDAPRVTTNALWDDGTPGTSLPPASYLLGIPAPVGPPVATDTGAGAITDTVDYVYTFVRKWSDSTVDEGPPSPVSNTLVLAARTTSVTMPNGAITTADYGITHKRLYRLASGTRFFVSESTIGTASVADNVTVAALGDAIETTDYLPPPDGMIGLIALPNGITAGFYGNTLYLSEPYRPWTYPANNQYTVNWPIVAIGNMLTSIVVATEAYPTVYRGVDPAAYSPKLFPGLFPCVSKRSMAGSEIGVLWASTGGIAGFDGANIALVTKEFLTRDEWRLDFMPTTMHAQFYDGRYYAWFTNDTADDGTLIGGGLVLDRGEQAFLVTLGEYVYAAAAISDTDEMWVVRRNTIDSNHNYVYAWEGNPQLPYTYEWKSKVFVSPGRENFAFAQIVANFAGGLSLTEIADLAAEIAAIQAANSALTQTDGAINGTYDGFEINGGPLGGDNQTQLAPSGEFLAGAITFKYWADRTLRLTRDVYNSEPFPLPSGFTGELHEFQVSGAVEITQVTLATSVEELASV